MKSRNNKNIVSYLFKRECSLLPTKGNEIIFTEDVGKAIGEEKATLPNKNQPCELSGQARSTMLVTFSPDGTKIASAHGDHSVRVTDIKSGKCTHILNGHPRTPWCLAFHPSSNDILASGCLGGEVRIWDLRGGGSETWKADQNLSIRSLTFHPTDMVLVIAIANEIKFWQWEEPKPFASCKTSFDYETIRWVKFDPLGNFLYTGITNSSTVHPDDEEISFIGSETTSRSERQQLHEQYRRIVEEIMSQRHRAQQGTGPASTSGVVPRLADTARAPFTDPPPRVDLDAERPHSPTQVDALNNAREYASAISRQANMSSINLSSRQTHEILANARALAAAVSRSASRSRGGSETSAGGGGLTGPSSAAEGSAPGEEGTPRAAERRRGTWGLGGSVRSLMERSSAAATTAVETPPVSRSSDFTVWTPRSRPSSQGAFLVSALSGSSTITTSSGGALSQGTQSAVNPPPARSGGGSRAVSLLQSQLENEQATSGSSTPSVQHSFFTSMLRMHSSPPETRPTSQPESTVTVHSSWLPASAITGNIVRPVTVVSLSGSSDPAATPLDRDPSDAVNSLATALPQQRLIQSSSSSSSSSSGQPGVATVLMSHLWPSTTNTDSSTSTTGCIQVATTAGTQDRHHRGLPRPFSSADPPACPGQCQICGNYPRAAGCRHRTCHPRAQQPSRHSGGHAPAAITTSVDSQRPRSSTQAAPAAAHTTTASASASRAPRSGSQTIASLIENEVRQTLNQVRARRLDISETLRDLDNLRRELETSPQNMSGPGPSANNPTGTGGQSAAVSSIPAPVSTVTSLPSSGSYSMDSATPRALPALSIPPPMITPLPIPVASLQLATRIPLAAAAGLQFRESVQEPDNPETPSSVPPRQIPLIVVDPYEEDAADSNSSGGGGPASTYRDTDSSSSGDPLSLPTDPRLPSSNTEALQHIGMFSAELERRVHQLDQRVTEIQDRLRDRMNALQTQREQDISSVRCRLASARAAASGGAAGRQPPPPSARERFRERQSSRALMRSHLEEMRSRSRSARHQAAREPAPPGDSNTGSSRVMPSRRDLESRAARFRRTQEDLRRRQQQREQRHRDRTWHTLQRRHLHPDYAVSILDDTVNRNDGLQAAINRAIAGAFMATGEASVASNIINQTFRIQRWDMSRSEIPDITDSEANMIVRHCKLHNDSSVDISQDGRLLTTFVHTHQGFPDDYILAVYSLNPDNLGDCLYTKSFGPNAITVSLSPCNRYALVGLASKRLAWVFTPKQMVAQVYKLATPEAGEDSMEHVCDIMHPCDMDIRTLVSLNTARWLPGVGEGITYGTNRGDLHIYRPGYEEEEKNNTSDGNGSESSSIRRNLMQMLGMTVPRTMSIATQTVQRVRRTASTQTDGSAAENAR